MEGWMDEKMDERKDEGKKDGRMKGGYGHLVVVISIPHRRLGK